MKTIIYSKGILDVENNSFIENSAVVIKENLIVAIQKNEQINPDPDDIILDLSNEYLLPGLIDSHSHGPTRPGEGNQIAQNQVHSTLAALKAANNLRKSLKSGVTTMRLMNSINDLDINLREAINNREIPGPRLFTSGGAVKPGGFGSYNSVNSISDIEKVIRQNVDKNVDVIKIFCDPGNYSREQIQFAVDLTHKLGKKISAHVLSQQELEICIDCGVDSIEHGGKISDDYIQKMIDKGIYLVATNTIFFHKEGLPKVNYQISSPDSEIAEKERALVLNATKDIKDHFPKFIASDVVIALGSDSMHGLLPFELEFLVEHGASPIDAIQSATINGAKLLGAENTIGSIGIGKCADIISVPDNPLENISTLWNVNLVMKDGIRYDQISLL